ncbi:MAG: hypothetical protein WCK42_05595 [Myxococcaceae bacterium]
MMTSIDKRIGLSEIGKQVSSLFDLPESRIMLSGAGRPNPCRSLAIHIAQIQARYTVKEIAEWMQIKPSSVTQALSKFRKQKIG